MGCADLGLGADDHGVEVPQGSAQLFGSIELLHDLMTLLTQSGQSGLIHSVGNKNTHNANLLQ